MTLMRIVTDKSRRRARQAPPGLAVLRERGRRLTGPRRLILDTVQATDAHPTAELVYRAVRRRLPRVSLGTVYRNLRVLVAEGLLQELAGPPARFDANLDTHHHFTCTHCGRIIDVASAPDEPARALAARVAARTGLRITHQRIDFYGQCARCGPPRAARRRPGRASTSTASRP